MYIRMHAHSSPSMLGSCFFISSLPLPRRPASFDENLDEKEEVFCSCWGRAAAWGGSGDELPTESAVLVRETGGVAAGVRSRVSLRTGDATEIRIV